MIPIEKEKEIEERSLEVAERMDGSKYLKSHLLRERAERGKRTSEASIPLIPNHALKTTLRPHQQRTAATVTQKMLPIPHKLPMHDLNISASKHTPHSYRNSTWIFNLLCELEKKDMREGVWHLQGDLQHEGLP